MSTLTVTIIQSDLKWEAKAENLEILGKKILSIDQKTELVILPEMFSTGFSMKPVELAEKMDGSSVDWMKKISAEKKIILAGSLIIQDADQYFNRLIWMLPNGQMGHYDKRHRFAYAGEDDHFAAGNKRMIASVKGWKINLLICYDLRFPVWARQQRSSRKELNQELEYDVLIYVANWPDKRSYAWRTLLQARAIENQSFVIGVNRVGDDGNGNHYAGESMIIDPAGEILYQGSGKEEVYTHTLSKARLEEVRTKFPFWKDADDFQLLNLPRGNGESMI